MTRVLHILPKLLVRAREYADLTFQTGQAGRRMSLRVHTDAFDAMPGCTKVRQPLPNHYYCVGGTNDTRYGWLVPLPDDLNAFDLLLEWRFRDDGARRGWGSVRRRMNPCRLRDRLERPIVSLHM